MSEEEKTESTETTSGPNKDIEAPEVVFVMDSWDGGRMSHSEDDQPTESTKDEE